ncbi:hypothetical protein EVAR_77644_1 [Eumeta japonica]|uniref:Uncharacterized protein n=1 Tax=Eumeta variegata TaxID=151549 RepID=A0A4C1T7Z2_EUMVA|nr:hypothetical protein EVAR_77644_1 [Eumeta japonica]
MVKATEVGVPGRVPPLPLAPQVRMTHTQGRVRLCRCPWAQGGEVLKRTYPTLLATQIEMQDRESRALMEKTELLIRSVGCLRVRCREARNREALPSRRRDLTAPATRTAILYRFDYNVRRGVESSTATRVSSDADIERFDKLSEGEHHQLRAHRPAHGILA